MITTLQRPSGPLGSFDAAGHLIEVYRHSTTALWLTTTDRDASRRPLGTIRWNILTAPRLQLAPCQRHWLMPHSPLAVAVVAQAMAIHRASVPEGEGPGCHVGSLCASTRC